MHLRPIVRYVVAATVALVGCTVADVTRPRTASDATDPAAPTPAWQSPSSPYFGAVAPASAPTAAAPPPSAGAMLVCPMHADVVRDAPGVCPKCGMTLVPQVPAAPHGAH